MHEVVARLERVKEDYNDDKSDRSGDRQCASPSGS